MAEVTIYINGRSYDITCDNGQEGRVVDLANYIDQKLQEISQSGGSYNDAHLVVLTALVLTDELFDLQEQIKKPSTRTARATTVSNVPTAANKEEEVNVLRILDQLTKRVDSISNSVQTL
ncbi:MAG: cell division protein ZapA [Alphaproteobacteria bacterium]|nr:cell division protein ZapA [Alphaproteobacteria bacterium]